MASISTRASVVALKEETTEGTLKAPSATGDYVAQQPDFSMSAEFETLENEELKNSLAPGKSILGLENPTATISHYLRHSGVEGQSTTYGKTLLKSAFGAEAVAGTEYDIAATSTISSIVVGGGEGANFRKGQPLLIKDPINGYQIRPVESISTDTLTPGFNLAGAPATGVNLGKAVTYYPVNSGHPSLSVWQFLGQGGAIQAMAGGKVTDLSIDFEAGQLINMTATVEGTAYYFNPLEATASSRYIDFDDGSEKNAQVALGYYKDPHDLAAAIQTAMDALSSDNITCTYSDSTGKYTIASDGGSFELLWNTGANTANTIGDLLGFSVAADDTGSLSYTSDNAIALASPQTPSFDDTQPLAAKDNTLFIGDADDNVCFPASSVSVSMSTPKTDILSICEESGKAGSVINAREVTIDVVALLEQYDVSKFTRFREGTRTRLMYVAGAKSGGNWIPGRNVMVYASTATITAFEVTDEDGLATLNMTLTAYAPDDGSGEFFIGMV